MQKQEQESNNQYQPIFIAKVLDRSRRNGLLASPETKTQLIPQLEEMLPSVRSARRKQEELRSSAHKTIRDKVFHEHTRTYKKASQSLTRANVVHN